MDMMSREREVRREREGWKGREKGSVGKGEGGWRNQGQIQKIPRR